MFRNCAALPAATISRQHATWLFYTQYQRFWQLAQLLWQ
jgi:hypothetical protein